MENAGALIRVSTAKQLAGTSPDKQREAIQELATQHGYSIDDLHNWTIAESGSLRERAGYQNALSAATNNEISRVYVFSIDRLGRNLLELLLFLRDLDDQGVDCWEAEGRRKLSWDDFSIQILGAVADKERKDLLKRSMDGSRRAVRDGKYPGGRVPYGYVLNRETSKLEIDPDEEKIVQMIFGWCVDDRLSAVKIADRLTALGIHTFKQRRYLRRHSGEEELIPPFDKWNSGKVLNILRNEAYTGLSFYGTRSKHISPEDRIQMHRPQIISNERFQQSVETRRSMRFPSPKHAKRKYLLRGLIKCSNCGLSYGGTTWKEGMGNRRYYLCNGRSQWKKLGREKCNARSLKADPIEGIIWEDVKRFIMDPGVAIEQLMAQNKPEDESLDEEIASIEAQINEFERQEENTLLIAAESHEVNVQSLDKVLAQIRRSITTLRAYKRQLKEKKSRSQRLEDELLDVASRLANLQDRIKDASFEDKRRAVSELVRGVRVSTEDIEGQPTAVIEVTYRFDEPISPLLPTPYPDTLVVSGTPRRA
jgi:site-specific DNA recombinase